MTNVIPFPNLKAPRTAERQISAAGEVVIFPGVRIVYHDDSSTVDLSCRIHARSGGTKP